MDVRRVTALMVVLVTLTCCSGASAQESRFTCKDFITQTAAQAYLDQDPSDPYGLDLDDNGMACDEPEAQVALEGEIAEEARLPLDARLGGTLEQWEAEFGPPVEQDGEHAELFTAYDIPDLGTVYADEHLGHIESITVFAPRPEGEVWTDDPHDMNWTVAEAHEIAYDFLPVTHGSTRLSTRARISCTPCALPTRSPPR